MANRELNILRDALHEHVNALAVDIGPRTPSIPDSLVRAANYIHRASIIRFSPVGPAILAKAISSALSETGARSASDVPF